MPWDMLERMNDERRILVLDRSVLAGNLYRLLFSSMGVSIIVRRRFEDVSPILSRRERVDLALFNSNIMGKKFDEILEAFSQDPLLCRLKKVFLLKEGAAERTWWQKLEALPGAWVFERPFHPDAFSAEVRRVLEGGA